MLGLQAARGLFGGGAHQGGRIRAGLPFFPLPALAIALAGCSLSSEPKKVAAEAWSGAEHLDWSAKRQPQGVSGQKDAGKGAWHISQFVEGYDHPFITIYGASKNTGMLANIRFPSGKKEGSQDPAWRVETTNTTEGTVHGKVLELPTSPDFEPTVRGTLSTTKASTTEWAGTFARPSGGDIKLSASMDGTKWKVRVDAPQPRGNYDTTYSGTGPISRNQAISLGVALSRWVPT